MTLAWTRSPCGWLSSNATTVTRPSCPGRSSRPRTGRCGDWRALVAGWARSPSKPMCAQYTGEILGAFDDDLNTPAAVRSLRALAADSELPPGSKFESFASYDQLFGLDLARDVGR